MKNVFISLFLILIFATLSACSGTKEASKNPDNANSSNSIEAVQPKEGGSITIGLTSEPSIFNPNYAAEKSALIIQQAYLAPLFYVNDGKVTPALADSLTASEDNLKYTLKLKKDLKWHDGQALTADDIVFTINSILDIKQNSWLRGSFVYDNKPVKAVKVDDTTVEFTLPKVTPVFESALYVLYPIPMHVYEGEKDIMKSPKNQHPIGSGPFKFVKYEPGQYVQLERFDDYFGGKPYLDKVVFRLLKDENAANLALQNGEINMKAVEQNDVKKVDSTGKVNIVTFPENLMSYLSFNQNNAEFKNVKFRQALSYALNRKDMIAAGYESTEFAEPASSILTPDVKYQTTDVETYPYDLEKAKQLLKESHVKVKRKLNLLYVNTNKAQEGIALYIQQQLKELGIKVQLDGKDAAATYAISDDRTSKGYDLYLDGYIMRSEPDAYKQLYKGDAIYNYPNYHNKEFDQLWDEGAITPNGDKRKDIYTKIQQLAANEAIVYPIAYVNNTIAIDKQFGGVDSAKTQPITLLRDFSKLFIKN